MNFATRRRFAYTGLLLFIISVGLLGTSDFVYAADRTVVGELYSADN